jgi:integrase
LANDLELLPYLVLGFFTGIRPDGELNRLEWKHFRWENKSVLITRKTSKVERKRDIPLSENSLAWLERYKHEGGSIHGKIVKWSEDALQTKREKNRERAGFPIGQIPVCHIALALIMSLSMKIRENLPVNGTHQPTDALRPLPTRGNQS